MTVKGHRFQINKCWLRMSITLSNELLDVFKCMATPKDLMSIANVLKCIFEHSLIARNYFELTNGIHMPEVDFPLSSHSILFDIRTTCEQFNHKKVTENAFSAYAQHAARGNSGKNHRIINRRAGV